ncbi:MAG: WYL domain-containing protein [Actinomycetota bacterium]|nr:WYL domain-containing protein [Actinomycetota bacterium]
MARPSAPDRLRRLLALVPWVVAHDGPTLEEVCARFGLTQDELVSELDLVFLCGVHPFTPDSLIDVSVADGRVWIRYADYLERPLRLTPDEGLALVAAGAAVLAVPGADPHGPLARGLAKLADVLGVDPAVDLDVTLGTAPAGVLESLQEAVSAGRAVEIDYYTYGRDQRTRRVVEPHSVFGAEGHWYLEAWCHLAEAERRFRLDRIGSLTVLDRAALDRGPAAPPADERPPRGQATSTSHAGVRRVFEPRPDDPRVVLDLEPRARWVAEQYPLERLEERDGGRCRVVLVVSERAWLERLLLRLGPAASVVEGADGVAAAAASRILAAYRPAPRR